MRIPPPEVAWADGSACDRGRTRRRTSHALHRGNRTPKSRAVRVLERRTIHAQETKCRSLYWIANEPAFGEQAVFLDDRIDTDPAFDANDPASWSPTMEELAAEGIRIVAPPIPVLLTLDASQKIVPSAYAVAAKAAGLDIITWTLERSGPLKTGGGYYYQSITPVIDNDGDMFEVLDVLAQKVGVLGVFSDWPATTTYYASCVGRK